MKNTVELLRPGNWHELVGEIAMLEELISEVELCAEDSIGEEPHAVWTIHHLKRSLKNKREMLELMDYGLPFNKPAST